MSGPGGLSVWGGVCVCSGGVCSRGGSAPEGGCLLPGVGVVSALGAGGVRYPPPVNRITDPCKNITLPQLRCGR